MVDVHAGIHAELERLAPAAPGTAEDWPDVLRRVRASCSPRGRVLVLAAAVVVVAVAAPTLALSARVRGVLGLDRSPALEQSRLVVSTPTGTGSVVRVWVSPATNGGQCWFRTIGPPGEIEHAPNMNGGGVCGEGRLHDARLPLQVTVGMTKYPLPDASGTWTPPVIDGWVDSSLQATRVELRWHGGSQPLAFDNDYFVGVSHDAYNPPDEKLPFAVVAYDESGREIARSELPREWLQIDQPSP